MCWGRGISNSQPFIFSFWIFRLFPVPYNLPEPLQMKSSMVVIVVLDTCIFIQNSLLHQYRENSETFSESYKLVLSLLENKKY